MNIATRFSSVSIISMILIIAVFAFAGTASADVGINRSVEFTQDELTNNWVGDRTFPTGGVTSVTAFSRDNVANIGIDSLLTASGGFNRTEGIKTLGAQNFGNTAQVDLYIDPAWENTAVRAGFWVVGDESGVRTANFGVVEFVNGEDCAAEEDCSTHPTNRPNHEGFRIFDGETGDWTNVSTAFEYGTWVTLGIELDTEAGEYIYYINGVEVGTAPGGGSFIRELFLNSYNYGLDNFPNLNSDSYAAHWSKLGYVATFNTIQDAIDAASDGDTIALGADVTVTAEVVVNKAITINGNGHTLSAAFEKTSDSNNSAIGIVHSDVTVQNLTIDGTSGTNLHGINVYVATDVVLDNVTVNNNDRSGLVVNGSTVSASNFNTSGNGWNAVNVDPGSGVTNPSVFTLNSGTLAEDTQIWSDGKYVTDSSTVTVNAGGYTEYNVTGGYPAAKRWANRALTGVATITGDDVSTIYSTIQAAINAADSGDTVNVAAGTYNESVLIDKSLTLQAAVHDGTATSTITGFGSGRNYIVKVDDTGDVTIDGFEVNGGGSTTGANAFTYGILVNASGDSDNPVVIKNSSVKNIWQNGSNGIGVENNSYVLAHNNTISSFHKRGIRFINSEGKFYSSEVVGDNVDGTSRVQNLVNLWGGSSVEVYGNKLHNALTTGDTPTWDSPAIFISSYGGSGASHADVHDNEIYNSDTGIVIGSVYADTGDSSNATVTDNDFHDLNWGINFEQSTAGAVVNENSFSNVTKALSAEADGDPITGPEVDATRNWWGSALSTDIEALVYAEVEYDPWYTNAGMTTLSDGEVTDAVYTSTTEGEADLPEDVTEVELTDDTVLDLSAGLVDDAVTLQSGVEGEDIVLTNADLSGFSASIPDGTNIQGPSGWDGKITPPVSGTPSGNAPAGFNVGGTVISVGSSDGTLVFDKAVTILLAGVTGTVGYRPAGSNDWQTITNVCAEPYATPGDPPAGSECAISNGTDTKIVTFHFTSFGGLNARPSTGSGGGVYTTPITVPASATPATPATPTVTAATPATPATPAPQGQVLGAATFNFAVNLRVGSRGADVTELQKVLIAEGFLKISTPTGYFGGLTSAAVQKYQKAHGVNPQSGFVGPLTRAVLNQGTNGAATSTLQSLQQQLLTLQARLRVLLGL